ncbi:MAG: hypothetical protein Q8O94_02530 [bacterium]|nr:hypothetical protein [bacterium]
MRLTTKQTASISAPLTRKLSHPQEKDLNRAELIADTLNKRDDVIEFRRDVLHGCTLAPDTVGAWVEKTETAERGKLKKTVPLVNRTFRIADGRPIRPIPGGVLDRLLDLAEALTRELAAVGPDTQFKCHWRTSQAIDFLLTGKPQLVPSIGASVAPDGLNLWVRFSVSPAELREFYSRALKSLGIAKQRDRAPISDLSSKSEQQRRHRQTKKLLGPTMDHAQYATIKLRAKDTQGAKNARQDVPTSSAVKRLGISRASLYRHAKTGKIKRIKTASGPVRWKVLE